jgi:hypothetical protein
MDANHPEPHPARENRPSRAKAAWLGGLALVLGVLLAGRGLADTPVALAVGQPNITSVSPNSGPLSGGNQVTIRGDNLVGSGTVVRFGTQIATFLGAFTDVQGTYLLVIVPAPNPPGVAQVVDISVSHSGGTSFNSGVDDYSYGASAVATVVQFAQASFTANENGGSAVINVTRTGNSGGAVSVNYAASGGTALAGVNYQITPGTVYFGNGQTTGTFVVTLIDDLLVNVNRTVNLSLSGPTGGATLGSQSNTTLTIVDDESSAPGGQLNFSAATYTTAEGGQAIITVNRTGATGLAVTIAYTTVAGTAGSGDFNASANTLSWGAGDGAPKTFTVQALQDVLQEGTEWLTLTLSNPTGGAVLGAQSTATLIIADDDWPVDGILEFTSPTYSVSEAATQVFISVRRVGNNPFPSSVSISYFVSNGSAISGSDYTATTGTLVFGANDTQLTFSIAILDDQLIEGDETVNLTLGAPSIASAVLGTQGNATLTIKDNDSITGPVISLVAPSSGPLSGGNVVTITGTGLANATLVSFGGSPAVITSNTATELKVTAPPRTASETVSVQVNTPLGSTDITALTSYTYLANLPAVSFVSPNTGPQTGGLRITITGANLANAVAVSFGGHISTTVTVSATGTSLDVTLPAGNVGTVDVLVATPSGTSLPNDNAKFTYTAAANGPLITYTLDFRWSLQTWGGFDNMLVSDALAGREIPDNPGTGDITSMVSVVMTFDVQQGMWLGYFTSGIGIPNANNLERLRRGVAYWIAMRSQTVTWTVASGG